MTETYVTSSWARPMSQGSASTLLNLHGTGAPGCAAHEWHHHHATGPHDGNVGIDTGVRNSG